MCESNKTIYCSECYADFNILHDMASEAYQPRYCPFCQAELEADNIEEWDEDDA